MRNSLALKCSTILAGTLMAVPGLAADLPVPAEIPAPTANRLPAVSGPNGKLAIFGGGFDADSVDGALYGANGAFSIPLGERFGLQVDGVLAGRDDDLMGGAAGHLFWRDPSFALLGLYGSWSTIDGFDIDTARFGVEGEAYFGRFSFESMVGWENLDFDGGDDDNIFALADLAFYVTDDLRLSAGYRHWNDMHMAAFGGEYQLPMNFGSTGVALFAEGRIGEDDYYAAWGGLRFYFGAEQKSLIRRHREDDPRVRMDEEFGAGAGISSGCGPNSYEDIDGTCIPLPPQNNG